MFSFRAVKLKNCPIFNLIYIVLITINKIFLFNLQWGSKRERNRKGLTKLRYNLRKRKEKLASFKKGNNLTKFYKNHSQKMSSNLI